MEPNGVMPRTEHKQEWRISEENKSADSDENCEEVWCNEEVDVIKKIDKQ